MSYLARYTTSGHIYHTWPGTGTNPCQTKGTIGHTGICRVYPPLHTHVRTTLLARAHAPASTTVMTVLTAGRWPRSAFYTFRSVPSATNGLRPHSTLLASRVPSSQSSGTATFRQSTRAGQHGPVKAMLGLRPYLTDPCSYSCKCDRTCLTALLH